MPSIIDLHHLLEAAARVEEGEPVPAHLEAFFGPVVPLRGGGRPKAVVMAEDREWIAKFRPKMTRSASPGRACHAGAGARGGIWSCCARAWKPWRTAVR